MSAKTKGDFIKGILILIFTVSFVGQSSVWVWSGFILPSMKMFISKKGGFNLAYTNDSFVPFFKEPYETLMAVLNDGRYFLFTEQRDNVRTMSSSKFQYVIEKCGFKLEDVAIIVHNHLLPTPITFNDKRFCRRLVYKGFKGKFLIYYPSHNKMREYKYPKEKDKY